MHDLSLMGLELAVLAAGLTLLLLDLWTPPAQKRHLGYVAAILVGVIFVGSFALLVPEPQFAFGGMYVLDELALFFKRFFLLAAGLILVMSVEFADRFEAGVAEYYALTLFALVGMMFAASAHDFTLLFVALELVTVCFYILTSFQRRRSQSLEAGVKYLIIGALSGGFMVYGIALIYGTAGTLDFAELAAESSRAIESRLLLLGLLMVFVGLGFKIAAVPFHIWAPDVYQGAPPPSAAFLAVGSKAAGIVLLIRLLHTALGSLADRWKPALVVVACLTILYGALCAIPQRNFRRLMGYSSITNAGFILLALGTGEGRGVAGVLFYLGGYLFSVVAAFLVMCLARCGDQDDETCVLAGLHRRSPLLAATLALAMVSLAGIPPLAGFMGKFLVFRAMLSEGGGYPLFPWALGIAVFGVVVSLYFYMNVVRTIYWTPAREEPAPIPIDGPSRLALYAAVLGLLWLGLLPGSLVNLADFAVQALGL
ncbi:MAG: NADH-quinone oxidoreductase subunit N [Verrucomicrobiales bacterium]|nr:NADH-quinone oxidoreductase subunit N [Verrucomicrobiales bacterium]